MRYINLTTVENLQKAHFIEQTLASQGIRCIVVNVHASSVLPHISGVTDGIQIRVKEIDAEKAEKILGDVNNDQPITCPNCGSKDFKTKRSLVQGLKQAVWLVGAVVFGMRLPGPKLFTSYYKCNSCGSGFKVG